MMLLRRQITGLYILTILKQEVLCHGLSKEAPHILRGPFEISKNLIDPFILIIL